MCKNIFFSLGGDFDGIILFNIRHWSTYSENGDQVYFCCTPILAPCLSPLSLDLTIGNVCIVYLKTLIVNIMITFLLIDPDSKLHVDHTVTRKDEVLWIVSRQVRSWNYLKWSTFVWISAKTTVNENEKFRMVGVLLNFFNFHSIQPDY